MRTIHYSIRFVIVLVLAQLFYLGITFLFHQAPQVPALIALLIIAPGTERLWVLLDWVGPVVGTMNKKRQAQDQKQIVEYLLECSLRYGSPLVIAALHSKRRVSLHVVSRFLRKSDIIVRTTTGYLLALMPFTNLEQASIPLKRITTGLPIKEVVVADVDMIQALLEAQRSRDNSAAEEHGIITSRELRRMCFQALDARFASIKSQEVKGNVPAVYNLFEPASAAALVDWLEAYRYIEPEDVQPAATGERPATVAGRQS